MVSLMRPRVQHFLRSWSWSRGCLSARWLRRRAVRLRDRLQHFLDRGLELRILRLRRIPEDGSIRVHAMVLDQPSVLIEERGARDVDRTTVDESRDGIQPRESAPGA